EALAGAVARAPSRTIGTRAHVSWRTKRAKAASNASGHSRNGAWPPGNVSRRPCGRRAMPARLKASGLRGSPTDHVTRTGPVTGGGGPEGRARGGGGGGAAAGPGAPEGGRGGAAGGVARVAGGGGGVGAREPARVPGPE